VCGIWIPKSDILKTLKGCPVGQAPLLAVSARQQRERERERESERERERERPPFGLRAGQSNILPLLQLFKKKLPSPDKHRRRRSREKNKSFLSIVCSTQSCAILGKECRVDDTIQTHI
jgi:hypothetical protein